jgi:hypothetical protein
VSVGRTDNFNGQWRTYLWRIHCTTDTNRESNPHQKLVTETDLVDTRKLIPIHCCTCYVRIDVLTAIMMMIFWGLTSWRLVGTHQRFGGTCCLHYQFTRRYNPEEHSHPCWTIFNLWLLNNICTFVQSYNYVMISLDHPSAIANVLLDSGIAQMVFVLCTELLEWNILYNHSD